MMENNIKDSKYQENSDLLDKLIEQMNSPQSESVIPQVASCIRPFFEGGHAELIFSRILTSNMIFEIRNSMLHSDPLYFKSATYIIKSIVSYLMVNKFARENLQKNDSTSRHILAHLKLNHFQSFWSLFFDLFDILDEKQFHLVEPFLLKLRKSVFVSWEFIPWLIIIVKKCVHHDNRSVAREGLMLILNSGLSMKAGGGGQEEKLACLKCLQDTIFPILKNVAWILPESEDYFACAENLGKLLGLICDDPVSILLDHVIQTKTGPIGPLSLYFLIRASKSCIAVSDFLKILTSVNHVLLYRLSHCDRFMKKQLQNLLIDLIYETRLKSTSQAFHCTKFSNLAEATYFHLFTFLGYLDDDIFCKNYKKLGFLLFSSPCPRDQHDDEEYEKFDKWILQKDIAQDHTQILLTLKQAPVKVKGFFRWILLHAVCPETSYQDNFAQLFSEYIETILSASDVTKLFTSSGEEEVHRAILDFANNVAVLTGGQKQLHLIPVLQFIFRYSLGTLCKLFQGSLSQIDFLVAVSFLNLVDVTKQWKESELDNLKDLPKLLPNEIQDLSHILLLKLLVLLQLLQPGDEQDRLAKNIPKICNLRVPVINVDMDSTLKNEFNSIETDLKAWALLTLIVGSKSANEEELTVTKDFLNDMASTAISLTDSGAHLTMKSAIKILQHTLVIGFRRGYESLLTQITTHVDELWKLVLDLRNTDAFYEVFPSFCEFICEPSFTGQNVLSKYSTKIFELSDSIQGLAYILSLALSKVEVNRCQCDARYEPFLTELRTANVTAACRGESLLKCTRMTFNVWDHLMKKEDLDNNFSDERISLPFCGNTKSRVVALFNIVNCYESLKHYSEERADTYLDSVAQQFLQFNEDETVDKKRYFQGSYIHRYKQRIAQSLLIIQPFFKLETSGNIMRRLVRSLGYDGAQASVRYLTEWIIINILIQHSELHAEFFQTVDECLLLRPGFGSILATLCMHSSVNLSADDDKTSMIFFDNSLKCVSDLLMSQNFIVRIFGNIALLRIFENAQTRGFNEIATKYQVMYNSAKRAVETAGGNFGKIYNNVSNDFYFKHFNSKGHFYCDIILIYVPRILNMVNDEIIHESELQTICSTSNLCLPFFSPSHVKHVYTNESKYSWLVRNGIADGREYGEESSLVEIASSSNPGQGSILQVKGNAWKYLPVAEGIIDFSEEIQEKKRSRKDQLVVVSSLVDCTPNVGGLCRTSEVFGASKFVLSSMTFLDDTNFKSCSVSAQNWIDILEVNASALEQFLQDYSAQGYTIVACEQAVGSKKLNTFTWPKKSVLLLGNEKFGVPPELLHLADHCVEIPQCGLVRSLNVHVSGALCIWSYASQHVL